MKKESVFCTRSSARAFCALTGARDRQLGIPDLCRIALAVTNAEEASRAQHATEDERRNQSLADDNQRDERACPCRETRTTRRQLCAVGERHGISLSEVKVPIGRSGATTLYRNRPTCHHLRA
jgi:hypothetical protein